MTQPPPDEKSKMSHFAFFIEKELSRLSKQNKMVLEKRIMDVALEIEMSTFIENEDESPAFPIGATAPILIPSQNPNLLS